MKLCFQRTGYILLCLLLTGITAAAQPFTKVRTFGLADGLPSNNVSRIVPDHNNLMWLSTWNGLCFYDGYQFTSYRSSDRGGTLSTHRIQDIAPDAEGNIWLITYDRRPYLLNTKLGKFFNIGEIIDKKIQGQYTSRGLATSATATWLIGEGTQPAVRVDATAQPLSPESIEIVVPSDLGHNAKAVLAMKADSLGNEWIFTDKGIALHGSNVTEPGDFEDVVTINGLTYFATSDGKFYTYTVGDAGLSRLVSPLSNGQRVNRFKAFGTNRLMAATDNGLAFYNTHTRRWCQIKIGAGPSTATNVEDIFADNSGRVWAFTSTGQVIIANPNSGSYQTPALKPTHGTLTTSASPIWVQDRFGTIWLAPAEGIFSYYDEETGQLVPHPLVSPELRYTVIPSIEKSAVDNHNNLWLCSSHDVTLVNFGNRTMKISPLVSNTEVRSLLPNPDGTVWASTSTGYIAEFSAGGNLLGYLGEKAPGQFGRVSSSKPFSHRIYSMFRDRDGDVWIGTKGSGIYVVKPDGSFRNYRHNPSDPYSIACDSVYDFDQDDRGNMWVATYGAGLILALPDSAKESIRFLGADNLLKTYPSNSFQRVRRVTHTSGGVIIASCTEGLLTFSNRFSNPSQIKFYSSRHVAGDSTSLRSSNVMQCVVTDHGEMFVSTMGGAVQRHEGNDLLHDQLTFLPLNDTDQQLYFLQDWGMGGNAFSMLEDERHNLYIVHENNIVVYNPVSKEVRTLGINDFGMNMEFTEAAPVADRETGELWFAAVGGVIHFNPSEIVHSPMVPNIVFTGVQFQGEPEKQKLINPLSIELHGDNRNFAISFAALDYSDNDMVQYAYRISDDKDWTYIGNSNSVQFTHLRPGVHRLYIKSTNSSGVWADNERYIDIMVHPKFWESAWGNLIKVLIFLSVITIGVFLYLMRRKNMLNEQLHRRERDFFINASHRLRTPLTLIGSPVIEVLKKEQLSDTGRMHLEKVRRNADQMLNMVNDMLKGAGNSLEYITDETVPHPGDIPSSDEISHDRNRAPFEAIDEAIKDDRPAMSAPGNQRVKLLVVEDNDDLRGFLRDILSDRYDVIVAPNGKIGLEKAAKEQPDFIITDITMPEMDGMTMVKEIKKNKSLSHIPIIVLSARASVTDRVEGLKVGIDDYITKPFSATYLRQRISNIRAQRKLLQQSFFEQIGREMRPDVNAIAGANANPVQNVDDTAAAPPQDNAPAGATPAPATENTQHDSQETPQPKPEYRLSSPVITDADQEMMEKLLAFMEARISDEDLKIEELAEAVNMGRTVFYGKIKALVGMSPSDFLRRLRMQRAEELIARSKMNFSQIAFNVGFSDPKYFTKCFKKETGMTPSEYRQNALRQQAEEQ